MTQVWAETKRLLETGLAFAKNSVLSIRLPLDTCLKGVLIRLSGTVVYTFSSTPVANPTSIFDNLVTRIEVVAGGERTVKNVKPHMVQMLAIYATGVNPARRASAAAAAAYKNFPLTDGGMVYGTSTQTTTILELLYLPFECLVAEGLERSATWLDTRGLASCDLRMITASMASLDITAGANATFTNADSTVSFEISTVEAKDFVQTDKKDWKQTTIVDTIASQVTDRRLDLPRGNKVTGIGVFTIEDSSSADGTDSNHKKPKNTCLDTIKLRKNGREIYSNTFRSIFDDNQTRGGMNTPFASSVCRRDGWAYIDLLQHKKLGTALDLRDANSFEFVYSSNASDATNNIYPIDVSVETSELVQIS